MIGYDYGGRKQMTVKLIALDLDGTTLNSKGHLSEGNKHALTRAIEEGVYVVIATGRCISSLPEEVLNLPKMQYVITSNGAKIQDLRNGNTVYSNCLAPELVEDSEKILRTCPHIIEIFVDGYAYIEKHIYDDIMTGEITYRHREYVKNTRNPVDGLMAFMLENKNDIENINIFFISQTAKSEWYPILCTLKNATVTSSLENNWEIGGATTSKASALAELGTMLGITKKEVMACGDSPNDCDMLNQAGIPVAVGNAKPPVKKIAYYITGTNDEDGVAEAVRKFVFYEEV